MSSASPRVSRTRTSRRNRWWAGALDSYVALGRGRGVFPPESRTSRLRLVRTETSGGLVAADHAVVSAGHR